MSNPPDGHVAIIRDLEPGNWHTNGYGSGISPGRSEAGLVARIIFDPAKHTIDQAQTWLMEHGYEPQSLTAAESQKPDELFIRALGLNLFDNNLIDQPNGGLYIKNVPLLVAGTWTDSAQKTPLEYSESTLERYATNWTDKSVWSRHSGGTPRNITEKIGEVQNEKYDSGAVVGDIYLHGGNQNSRDTIEMVRRGLANYVSVEHAGKEKWNVGKKVYQAEELEFRGLAIVNRGACSTCQIPRAASEPEPGLETILTEPKDIDMTELTELESKMDAKIKQLSEMAVTKIREASEASETKVKELSDKLEKSEIEKRELAARLEKIEKAPVLTTQVNDVKELEPPALRVVVDKNKNEVYLAGDV